MKTVKKYLIPSEENQYKPHLLRKASLAVIATLSVAIFALGVFQNTVFMKSDFLSAVISRVLVDLANENRVENNLNGLTSNPMLEEAARQKAEDMASKGYFAHNSPDGTTPWYWIKNAGYKFAYAGENLAVNFSDSEDVDKAWMNSPGHRANILHSKFTEIGIATARGEYKGKSTVFVVQMFGRPIDGDRIGEGTASAVLAQVDTQEPTAVPQSGSSVAVLGEASETVLAESAERIVPISPTETYIEIENADLFATPQEEVTVENSASPIEELASQPTRVINTLYLIISGILILSIALAIGIEMKRQHPKIILAGFVLLAFVLTLMYIYQGLFWSQVVIV